MKRTLIFILIAVVVALAAWFAYAHLTRTPDVLPPEEPAAQTGETPLDESDVTGDVSGARGMSIEEYVRQNISALSPEPEVLGGTYYVTEIEAHGGVGTVSYEDGHVAHTADFSYEIDELGKITITSFVIRPEPAPR